MSKILSLPRHRPLRPFHPVLSPSRTPVTHKPSLRHRSPASPYVNRHLLPAPPQNESSLSCPLVIVDLASFQFWHSKLLSHTSTIISLGGIYLVPIFSSLLTQNVPKSDFHRSRSKKCIPHHLPYFLTTLRVVPNQRENFHPDSFTGHQTVYHSVLHTQGPSYFDESLQLSTQNEKLVKFFILSSPRYPSPHWTPCTVHRSDSHATRSTGSIVVALEVLSHTNWLADRISRKLSSFSSLE